MRATFLSGPGDVRVENVPAPRKAMDDRSRLTVLVRP